MTFARRRLFVFLTGLLTALVLEAAASDASLPSTTEQATNTTVYWGNRTPPTLDRPPLAQPPPLPESIRRGDPPPTLPQNLPAPEELREHFLLLRRFLELSPEQLTQIRETIERIEKMDPDRKATMLAKIREVQTPLQTHTPPPAPKDSSAAADPLPAVLDRLTSEQKKQVEELVAGFSRDQRLAFYQGLTLRIELESKQSATDKSKPETGNARSIEDASTQ